MTHREVTVDNWWKSESNSVPHWQRCWNNWLVLENSILANSWNCISGPNMAAHLSPKLSNFSPIFHSFYSNSVAMNFIGPFIDRIFPQAPGHCGAKIKFIEIFLKTNASSIEGEFFISWPARTRTVGGCIQRRASDGNLNVALLSCFIRYEEETVHRSELCNDQHVVYMQIFHNLTEADKNMWRNSAICGRNVFI